MPVATSKAKNYSISSQNAILGCIFMDIIDMVLHMPALQ